MIEQPTLRPRTWLKVIRARYDDGAVALGVWEVIKDLEAHEAWRNHIDWGRRAVAPSPHPADRQTGGHSRARSNCNEKEDWKGGPASGVAGGRTPRAAGAL